MIIFGGTFVKTTAVDILVLPATGFRRQDMQRILGRKLGMLSRIKGSPSSHVVYNKRYFAHGHIESGKRLPAKP
eukprot:1182716-Prorocentrum_minimum.AAC.2